MLSETLHRSSDSDDDVVRGVVQQGDRRGRRLRFPTANIHNVDAVASTGSRPAKRQTEDQMAVVVIGKPRPRSPSRTDARKTVLVAGSNCQTSQDLEELAEVARKFLPAQVTS